MIMTIIITVKYDFTVYSSVYITVILYYLYNLTYNKVLISNIIQGEYA